MDLKELIKDCFLAVPPCRGSSNGFFSKIKKVTFLHYRKTPAFWKTPALKICHTPRVDDLFIQDGMAPLHTVTTLPPTIGEVRTQDQGSTHILSTSNHLTWLTLSEKTRLLCHSPQLLLEQFTYLVYRHISKYSASPSAYQSVLEPHIQHVNHRVALYK